MVFQAVFSVVIAGLGFREKDVLRRKFDPFAEVYACNAQNREQIASCL